MLYRRTCPDEHGGCIPRRNLTGNGATVIGLEPDLNKGGTKLLTVLHNTGRKTATVNGKPLPAGHLSFTVTP